METYSNMPPVKWKYLPAIFINKKYHSDQWFLAFKCEWGLPKLQSIGCYPLPMVIDEEPGEYKKQGEQGNRIGPR